MRQDSVSDQMESIAAAMQDESILLWYNGSVRPPKDEILAMRQTAIRLQCYDADDWMIKMSR